MVIAKTEVIKVPCPLEESMMRAMRVVAETNRPLSKCPSGSSSKGYRQDGKRCYARQSGPARPASQLG